MTWKVKAALARRRLRVQDLATALGKTKSCISQVLSGEHKGYALRAPIAQLLGLSPDALAKEIDKAKKERVRHA